MRSWSTVIAALLALAVGTGNAAAEARPTGGGWNQTSIGRLGPLGTSNSLFHSAVAGTSVGVAHAAKGTDDSSDDTDDKKGGISTTALVIGGGAAVGIGVFIAAVSGGGSSDIVSNNPNTPGGSVNNPSGGGNSGGDGLVPSTGGGTGGSNGNTGSVGGSDPATVTPEPASMALLASGLAGMGGFQLRRHRRRIQDEK